MMVELLQEDEHTTRSDNSTLSCPWCGAQNTELYEVIDDDEIIDIDCGACLRPIVLVVKHSIRLTGYRGKWGK